MVSRKALGIHTVFIARENIFFLKEWILYHAMLGFERFYLYENTGSIGREGSTDTTNKYGINFHDLTRHLSDRDINEKLRSIIKDVPAEVVLIPWQPRDEANNIIYGQIQSINHCVETYADRIEWMAFIDVDEFIFSESGVNIRDYLDEMRQGGCGNLVVYQKKFLDRFLASRRYVIDIYECIEGISTACWGPKNIVFLDDIDLENTRNIHTIQVRRRSKRIADMNELRFNHYNVNDAQLEWMKEFYGANGDFTLNARDDGMRRYRRFMRASKGASIPWRRRLGAALSRRRTMPPR